MHKKTNKKKKNESNVLSSHMCDCGRKNKYIIFKLNSKNEYLKF
jgi:hypothetical protein